jgi:hypothetical protein
MGGSVLIGESSWDLICFNQQGYSPSESLLHNDFFTESNRLNTKKLRRVYNTLKICLFTLCSITKGRSVFFSSMNSEVMIIAIIFSWYKGAKLFIPNVIGNPNLINGNGGKISRLFFKSYVGKIIVTDKVTEASLIGYKPQLSSNWYSFCIPKKNQIANLRYIIVLPAVLSHVRTKSKVNSYYSYCMELASKLSNVGRDVYFLPHPREEGTLSDDILQTDFGAVIKSCEIAKFGDNVCYLSAYSSLSLNKRYGGKFGLWVGVDGQYIFPSIIKHSESEITPLDYLL